jgi:hypothetical protein
MKQTFIALTIFALVGLVIVAFNGSSDVEAGSSLLAQSDDGVEPEILEPENFDEADVPDFSVSGDLSITLPQQLAEMAGDVATCLNESDGVVASLADGVLTLEFSDLGGRDLLGIMTGCDLPWPDPHGFDFHDDAFGFHHFGPGFPEGFEVPEEMQERLDSVKECFHSAPDREAIESCLAELDLDFEFGHGPGFRFFHGPDDEPEAPAGDVSA